MKRVALLALAALALPSAALAVTPVIPNLTTDVSDVNGTITSQEVGSPVAGENVIVFASLGPVAADPPSFSEFTVTPGLSYEVVFADVSQASGGLPLNVSNAGFFLSPTEIPLSDLNITNDPPTGSANSPFTPLPNLDGNYGNGQKFSEEITVPAGTSTPLPGGALMGLAGFAAVGAWQLARRKSQIA